MLAEPAGGRGDAESHDGEKLAAVASDSKNICLHDIKYPGLRPGHHGLPAHEARTAPGSLPRPGRAALIATATGGIALAAGPRHPPGSTRTEPLDGNHPTARLPLSPVSTSQPARKGAVNNPPPQRQLFTACPPPRPPTTGHVRLKGKQPPLAPRQGRHERHARP
jgi:hypothetical protein